MAYQIGRDRLLSLRRMALPGLGRIRPTHQSPACSTPHIPQPPMPGPHKAACKQNNGTSRRHSLVDRDHPALQSTSNLLTFSLIVTKDRRPQSKSAIVQPPNSLVYGVVSYNTHHGSEQFLFGDIHIHRHVYDESRGKVGSMWSFWVIEPLPAMYDSCTF